MVPSSLGDSIAGVSQVAWSTPLEKNPLPGPAVAALDADRLADRVDARRDQRLGRPRRPRAGCAPGTGRSSRGGPSRGRRPSRSTGTLHPGWRSRPGRRRSSAPEPPIERGTSSSSRPLSSSSLDRARRAGGARPRPGTRARDRRARARARGERRPRPASRLASVLPRARRAVLEPRRPSGRQEAGEDRLPAREGAGMGHRSGEPHVADGDRRRRLPAQPSDVRAQRHDVRVGGEREAVGGVQQVVVDLAVESPSAWRRPARWRPRSPSSRTSGRSSRTGSRRTPSPAQRELARRPRTAARTRRRSGACRCRSASCRRRSARTRPGRSASGWS